MTFKCQVACAHCQVQAGPHRTEVLRDEDAEDWMTQASVYRDGVIKAVNLTGGEPFFDLGALRRLVALAVGHGLVATAVTNAHWAVSPDAALETLASVPGLFFLQISADELHQAEIPFERVMNAIAAAETLGLIHRVVVCTEDPESPAHQETLRRLHEKVEPSLVETVVIFSAGRAMRGGLLKLRRETTVVPRGGCAGADSPVIMPDGRVMACVGPVLTIKKNHPLVLVNLNDRSLADILDDAEVNPVLHVIRLWGPATLLDLLTQRGGVEHDLPARFVPDSICDVCQRLFSNDALIAAARDLGADEDLREVVAMGRARHLGEDEMLQRLGLTGE
jgi:hypothetical protein